MAAVYRGLGGTPPFELRVGRLLALTVAVLAGAAVNLLATQLVTRIGQPAPSPTPLWRTVLGEARSWALELGIAVVAVLVAQRMPLLTVTLLLPLLPIHAAFRAVTEAQARRAEAEAARAEAEAARGQAEQVADERAKLIEARNRLIVGLRQLDRQKDELLARVSRELRTPAASILSMVRTLTQDPDRFSQRESLELLVLVLDQAQQLDRLIGRLLLAARLEQSQFDADPATLELADAAVLARRAGQLAGLTYPDRPGAPWGAWPCWRWRTAGPASRRSSAPRCSSASPSSTTTSAPRARRPAGSASASLSPASWPAPRAARCWRPTLRGRVAAPASSCASRWRTTRMTAARSAPPVELPSAGGGRGRVAGRRPAV
jgi:His Kinase A (phospho-acceptor) domain